MELGVRGMAAFICCLGPLEFKVIYEECSKHPWKGHWWWGLGGAALEPSSAGYLHAEQLLIGLNTIWPIQIVLSGVKAPLNLRQPRPSFDGMAAGDGGGPTASRGSSRLWRDSNLCTFPLRCGSYGALTCLAPFGPFWPEGAGAQER